MIAAINFNCTTLSTASCPSVATARLWVSELSVDGDCRSRNDRSACATFLATGGLTYGALRSLLGGTGTAATPVEQDLCRGSACAAATAGLRAFMQKLARDRCAMIPANARMYSKPPKSALALVEIISGKALRTNSRRRNFRPLNDGHRVPVPGAKLDRFAANLIAPSPDKKLQRSTIAKEHLPKEPDFLLRRGGLTGTTADYVRLLRHAAAWRGARGFAS